MNKLTIWTNSLISNLTILCKLHRSCAVVRAAGLGLYCQDSFRPGTFGGFPTCHFALPALTSYWILTLIQLSQFKDRQNVAHKQADICSFRNCSFFITHWGPNWPSWENEDFPLTGVPTGPLEKVGIFSHLLTHLALVQKRKVSHPSHGTLLDV